jgi:hypothetical protein
MDRPYAYCLWIIWYRIRFVRDLEVATMDKALKREKIKELRDFNM